MRNIEKYRKSYLDLPFERKMEELRRRIVLNQVKIYKPRIIFEIGCGLKSIGNYLNLNELCFYIFEIDSFFADHAKQELGLQATIVNEAFENSNLDISPDLIIVSCLLHEIDNRATFLRKIYEYSNLGTVIHFNVPNANSLHRQCGVYMNLLASTETPTNTQNEMQQFSKAFNLRTLALCMESNGFEIICDGGYFIKTQTHSQLQHLWNLGLIDDGYLDGMFSVGICNKEVSAEIYVNVRKAK